MEEQSQIRKYSRDYFPSLYTAAVTAAFGAIYARFPSSRYKIIGGVGVSTLLLLQSERVRKSHFGASIIILSGIASWLGMIAPKAILSLKDLVWAVRGRDFAQMQWFSFLNCVFFSCMAPCFTVWYPQGEDIWQEAFEKCPWNFSEYLRKNILANLRASVRIVSWQCFTLANELDKSSLALHSYKLASQALFVFSVGAYLSRTVLAPMHYAPALLMAMVPCLFAKKGFDSFQPSHLAIAAVTQERVALQQEWNKESKIVGGQAGEVWKLKKTADRHYEKVLLWETNKMMLNGLVCAGMAWGLEPLLKSLFPLFGKTLNSLTELHPYFLYAQSILLCALLGERLGIWLSQQTSFKEEQVQKIKRVYKGEDASPYTEIELIAKTWVEKAKTT